MENQMQDCETTIYNMLHGILAYENSAVEGATVDGRDNVFVLINPHEIDILRENRISVRGIQLHYYDKYNLYNSYKNLFNNYTGKKYEDKEVYLLGTGPLLNHRLNGPYADKIPPNIHVMTEFNCLKYLSKYGAEFLTPRSPNPEGSATRTNDNALFVDALRKNYEMSLFYCPYNTGLVGVEGYLSFREEFYKYLDTVDTIYLINCNSGRTWWEGFLRKVDSDEILARKIKHLTIDVCELYRTNPELIAYYRIKVDTDGKNYLDKHYNFSHTFSHITDRIIIGNDSYKYIGYTKSNNGDWFPSSKITHIINVSTDVIECPDELLECGITYEHYPIDERKENCSINKSNLFRAAERINELLGGEGGGGEWGGQGGEGAARPNCVYIHCSLGMNRSPAAVLLYFIKYCGFSLYDAFAAVAKKRQIMTSVDLFDTIYNFAREGSGSDADARHILSPLKLRTNYVLNFCQPDAYYYALYDTIYIAELNKK